MGKKNKRDSESEDEVMDDKSPDAETGTATEDEPVEEEFVVEKVLNHRMNHGKREYFLAWKGYGP